VSAPSPKGTETLFLGLCGSYAYGTNVATSDEDWRGVYRYPTERLLGLRPPADAARVSEGNRDVTWWELGNFARQLANGSLMAIEMLWLDGTMTTPEFEAYRALRQVLFTPGLWRGWNATIRAYRYNVMGGDRPTRKERRHATPIDRSKAAMQLLRLSMQLALAAREREVAIRMAGYLPVLRRVREGTDTAESAVSAADVFVTMAHEAHEKRPWDDRPGDAIEALLIGQRVKAL
jgi:predicted nucleotidyltransferase